MAAMLKSKYLLLFNGDKVTMGDNGEVCLECNKKH